MTNSAKPGVCLAAFLQSVRRVESRLVKGVSIFIRPLGAIMLF